MKAAYEHVQIGAGHSVRVFRRALHEIPFEWHHHAEYELTLTLNSQGKRYVGDAIDDYRGPDLVLVPPDLPHTWVSTTSLMVDEPQLAIVIWFDGDWIRRLADCCVEYEAPIRALLRRAALGLSFQPIGEALIERFTALLSDEPRKRLYEVLEILCALVDMEAKTLASPAAFRDRKIRVSIESEPERLYRALALIDTRFSEPITLAQVAAAASVSTRTVNRYFVQHLGESVGRYVNRVRIGRACRLLIDTSWTVSVIASRTGFANAANFNRQFRKLKRTTPLAYRAAHVGKSAPFDDAMPIVSRPTSLDRRATSVYPPDVAGARRR